VKSCNVVATFSLLMGSYYHSALFHQSHFSQYPCCLCSIFIYPTFLYHVHIPHFSVTLQSFYIAQTVVPVISFSLTLVTTIQQGTPVLSVMLICPLASFKYISGKSDNSVSVSVWGIII